MTSFQKFGNAHFRGDVKIDGKLITSAAIKETDSCGISKDEIIELINSGVSRVSDTLNQQIRMSADTTVALKSELTKRMDGMVASTSKETRDLSLRIEALESKLQKSLSRLEELHKIDSQAFSRESAPSSQGGNAVVQALIDRVNKLQLKVDSLDAGQLSFSISR